VAVNALIRASPSFRRQSLPTIWKFEHSQVLLL